METAHAEQKLCQPSDESRQIIFTKNRTHYQRLKFLQFLILRKRLEPLSRIRYVARLANNAGVTQLVECNLAKVDVASSSLVTRSSFCLSEA